MEPNDELTPRERKAVESNPLRFLVDSQLSVEGLRIATQVRNTHLKLQERSDPETELVLTKLNEFERFIDNLVAKRIKVHPAYPWFSRVKGVGRENIGKVVAMVDIRKAENISSLWKFAGYHVVDGHAPKAVRGGGKLEYNKELRTMCWRLASSLLRAKGVFYNLCIAEKERLQAKFAAQGVKIVPTLELPKKDGKFYEPEGMISTGHVHNMALRKMIKVFLACLWLYWREAEGLPIRDPYPVGHLGHTTVLTPEKMTDRPIKTPRRRKPEASAMAAD